jgi:hypothetical protein
MPIKGACVVAGISVTTPAEWRASQPDLEARMSEARQHARQKALQAIKRAGEKDWRAHAEWLRLSFPADYRGSANKIEVNGTASIFIRRHGRQIARTARTSACCFGIAS